MGENMKLSTFLGILGMGMSLATSSVQAHGGGHGAHFHGGWHGGVGHHWGGGRVYHGNYGYRGYYSNNYYGGGWGGYGYGWPGYITGGPVGYYTVPRNCYKKVVCPRRHHCYTQTICRH